MQRPNSEHPGRVLNWGWAWLALGVVLALHVWDETAHDFLSVYNPAATALRERLPFLPLPTFSFGPWLGGLIGGILLLLLLSRFAFKDARWLRPIAFALAVMMIFNGLLHGVGSVFYNRLIAGTYTSPLLVAAAIWLILLLRRSRHPALSLGGDHP